MATSHIGANYFLQQVRTYNQHANEATNASGSKHTQILEMLSAPYKGLKQNRSTRAVLSTKGRNLTNDRKKIELDIKHSIDQSHSQTSPISLSDATVKTEKGADCHVPYTKPRRTLNHNPKPVSPNPSRIKLAFRVPPSSGIKFKFKIPKPSGTKLGSTIEFKGISKRQTQLNLNLADKDRLPRDQENRLRHLLNLPELPEERPKKSIIKFKVHQAENYSPKPKLNAQPPTGSQKPKLVLRLPPEEQYQTRPKVESTSGDEMDIDTHNESTTVEDEFESPFITALKANNKRYSSTRYFPVNILQTEMTEEYKQQQEQLLTAERKADNTKHARKERFPRSSDSDYLKALEIEAKKPTLAPSQVNEIRQRLATSGMPPIKTYDQRISRVAINNLVRAERIINTKAQIVKLIRLKELWDKNTPRPVPNHVLSAVPHHVVKETMVMGRIEYGTETEGMWSPRRCACFSTAKGVDITKVDIEALRAKYASM